MNEQTPIHRKSRAKAQPSPSAEPIGRLAKKYARALADPQREEKSRRWKEENAAAIAEWNEWVREHGLPLAPFRKY